MNTTQKTRKEACYVIVTEKRTQEGLREPVMGGIICRTPEEGVSAVRAEVRRLEGINPRGGEEPWMNPGYQDVIFWERTYQGSWELKMPFYPFARLTDEELAERYGLNLDELK